LHCREQIGKGDRLPDASLQQAAVGPQGSGDTLNTLYSAEEMLKASVSIEGRINVLLWYRLVGALSGCFRTVLSPPFGQRECAVFGLSGLY